MELPEQQLTHFESWAQTVSSWQRSNGANLSIFVCSSYLVAQINGWELRYWVKTTNFHPAGYIELLFCRRLRASGNAVRSALINNDVERDDTHETTVTP